MATEFIVKLRDRPGSLAAAAQALADGGVNLWGTAATTGGGKGTVGFVVKDKDATKARRARAASYACSRASPSCPRSDTSAHTISRPP